MSSDKDEIRARSDVVDVIGAVVTLKKRGRNHVGLCPFHQEKTPSFNVDPVTQTFTCFGCGVKGDVFTFVEKYQNMTFVEAAEYLARRAGLTFERKGGQTQEQSSERERMIALNELAARYFQDKLKKVESASGYLQSRGIAHDTIKRFRIGFALDDWQALAAYLQSQKQDLKLAAAAGLLNLGRTGDYYDVFRNRILFPILDEQERIVGFGGRSMGDEQPKYLNTGETPIFAKSKLLYGLPFARRAIAAEGRTLLMEGYTDVIAAHQAGFHHAVATLGTSLTEEHAKKLARLAPTVVLVYDADSAGIKATLRASELLEGEGIQVRVARLPSGEDPDSLLRQGGVSAFQKALDQASGRAEYQLETITAGAESKDDSEKQLMLRQVVEILASIPTRSERDVYVSKMWRYHPMSSHGPSVASEQLHRDAESRARARRGGTSKSDLERAVPPEPSGLGWDASQGGHYRRWENDGSGGWRRRAPDSSRSGYRQTRTSFDPPPKAGPGPKAEERAEREILRALTEPQWRSTVFEHIHPDDLFSEDARRFAHFVHANNAELGEDPSSLSLVLDRREEPEFSLRIRQQLQEISAEAVKVPVTEAAIKGCAETLRRYRELELIQRRKSELFQSKQELSGEDRERVLEYQTILRKLKGSGSGDRAQGE